MAATDYTRSMVELRARMAANWTSGAGALEGILAFLGGELPRHAVMGLTGHAWHFCLGSREGVVALPSGPTDLDRAAMCERYSRTGWRWERYTAQLPSGDSSARAAVRNAAIAWAIERLDAEKPLIGWDFHLHEHGVVYGYDRSRAGFLVDDPLTPEFGEYAAWEDWPPLGQVDLMAPLEPVEPDPIETIAGALQTASDCFAGKDGPDDGQPRGTAGILAWADAFESETEVDRAGNAYTLAVLQTARLDGIDFLADVAAALPDLEPALGRAQTALREQTKALAPLITLFPFPTGGHGNVANPGLRRAAAMALRRAAQHEANAAAAMADAVAALGE